MVTKRRKVRVLLAKAGLDGHDRGIKVVALSLRDAGMEVIYTGLHRTPKQIVNTALQEGVDVLGMSFLSGAQNTLVPEIMTLMENAKINKDVHVILGGFIPDENEIVYFKKLGVKEIFGTDSRLSDIVAYFRSITNDAYKEEGL